MVVRVGGLMPRIGDKRTHSEGYVLVYRPDHPKAHNGYVYEHVLVWEEAHGSIEPGMCVHHRNENKRDNRLENLELQSRADHALLHRTRDDFREMQRRAAETRRRTGSYEGPAFCSRGHDQSVHRYYIKSGPNAGKSSGCGECRRLRSTAA